MDDLIVGHLQEAIACIDDAFASGEDTRELRVAKIWASSALMFAKANQRYKAHSESDRQGAKNEDRSQTYVPGGDL